MFHIEANEDNPPIDTAELVLINDRHRGDDKASGHGMLDKLPQDIDTRGHLWFIGMRAPRVDFTTPAICAIRTSRQGNFIGWEKIETGTTVIVGQLKLTSL